MNSRPSGLTLLELLLVLLLLAVIGSIATPAVFGGFSSVRLRRAGDAVLASWSEARTRAIQTGEIQEFSCERETGNYRLQPHRWDPLNAATYGRDPDEQDDESDQGRDSTEETRFARIRTLPEGLQFRRGQFTSNSGEPEPSSTVGDRAGWSQPVLFFPDGTVTTSSVILANDRDQFVRLTLRGLTGVGRATDVLTRDELDRMAIRR